MNISTSEQEANYALSVANASYDWYKNAAIRARRSHRSSATLIQAIAASIPVAAVVSPTEAIIPAILGAIIVILSGLRAIFRWQENYLRFSGAREAVEAERRLYHMKTDRYSNHETRDNELVARITKIEQDEMAGWIKIASEHPR